MVIQNVGLYNLPPAYQETNYHPQAEYRPYMQYGAWCQLWATTHGEGRVVAFGHGGFLSAGAADERDTGRLIANAVRWAAGDAPEVLARRSGRDDHHLNNGGLCPGSGQRRSLAR